MSRLQRHAQAAPRIDSPESSLRLQITLLVFITLLLLVLSGSIVVLVGKVVGRFEPTVRADLGWKAEHGPPEIAQVITGALARGDRDAVNDGLRDWEGDTDILGVVVTDKDGKVIAQLGKPPVDAFSGDPGQLRGTPEYLTSWNEISAGDATLGRIAIAVSTVRLSAGASVRREILWVTGIGFVGALLISVMFVSFRLGPLLALAQRNQRMNKELEIASTIQTSLLPKQHDIAGLEISSRMVPADEVGGDYFDVIPTDDGAWIAIGDVTGHGLDAGLMMLMIQSALGALARDPDQSRPHKMVSVLNHLLWDNIRNRLGRDDHATFALFRYRRDGTFTFAGAHEELVVLRAGAARCEQLATPGPWIGIMPDISRTLRESSVTLANGDMLVLYTDGAIEARNAAREQFGIERFCAAIENHRALPLDQLRDRVIDEVRTWSGVVEDDITLLILRYGGA